MLLRFAECTPRAEIDSGNEQAWLGDSCARAFFVVAFADHSEENASSSEVVDFPSCS